MLDCLHGVLLEYTQGCFIYESMNVSAQLSLKMSARFDINQRYTKCKLCPVIKQKACRLTQVLLN